MTGFAGLHHVALSVRDLDASVAWYREVLGLHEEVRLAGEDRRWAVVRVAASGQQLGLVEHRTPGAAFEPRNIGLDHVALAVGTRDELVGWDERLRDRGVETSGVVDAPFGAMLHFRDPDGIALAVFWNRRPPAAVGGGPGQPEEGSTTR